MSTKKSAAAKKTAQPRTDTHSKKEYEVLKLETGIPLPLRSFRDPVFMDKVDVLVKGMKVNQSFVVPKERLHAVKRLVKVRHEELLFKSSLIKPDEKFARVWRVR